MGFAEDIGSVAVDATFAAFGKAATYVPPGGGTPVPCVVMRDVRDAGADLESGEPTAGLMVAEVRRSEVSAPAHGGAFTLTSGGLVVLTISNRPIKADPDGLVWRMWVVEND